MMRMVPRTDSGEIVRPRRMAASIPVYSAAWIPAVIKTVGPATRPAIAMYGQSYFASPASPANVNVPVARSPAGGISIGPIFKKELHPNMDWIVSESGSNSAIKLVLSNTIDVGFVSRALTDAEKQQVTGVPIGFSGTAVVVNAANPLTNLSKEQLRKIYSGEVMS